MKKENNFLGLSLLVIGIGLFLVIGCDKDDDNPPLDNTNNGNPTAVFNPAVSYGTMKDIDGNTYKTVTIGNQTWMAENLRVTKYNDGTSIPNVTDTATWNHLTTGAYSSYNNNTWNAITYGQLYNWHAVNSGKLAPTGWHVPTDAEWTTLIDSLGGREVAGAKLKETGTTHWNSPNLATNESGFTALPAGYRTFRGSFYDMGNSGGWWIAAGGGVSYGGYRYIGNNTRLVYGNYYYRVEGFSVRCVKD